MPRVATIYPQHILEAMEKDKPSKDPTYWAKKGCRDCLGRGVVGKITQKFGDNNKVVNEQLCSCVKKAFAVWQEKWMEEHKDKSVELPKEIQVSALDPEMGKSSPIEERIDRIEKLCTPIRDEIIKLKDKRDQLPEEHKLATYQVAIEVAEQEVQVAKELLQATLAQADDLDEQANTLYARVKELRHQAELKRTKEQADRQQCIRECEFKLQGCLESHQQVQALIKRDLHRLSKKIKELEDKLDRLEDRRVKVLKSHGLDLVITQEIIPPT